MYVTLEPCCHHGKTPPCTDAILRAGIRRVVVAHRDPFPGWMGAASSLRTAGVEVEVGLMEAESRWLNAPYLKLLGRRAALDHRQVGDDPGRQAGRAQRGQPLDFRPGFAAALCPSTAQAAMDAILVGAGTARADDPSLTVRPPGARTPVRIVLDSRAALSVDSRLVRTARETPVLIAAGPHAAEEHCQRLQERGCEVWISRSDDGTQQLLDLLDELGRRQMTNLLVEGGAQVLGSLFDAKLIDEVHVFIATKMIGGSAAPSPLAGHGLESMQQAIGLSQPVIQVLDGDIYVHGRMLANGGR
jgi:diaminohydroxyphosphoribosylaminopyrimidine deaminase / 5-amino-6-(5-phosphoribosylamino)uracil reductase